MAEIAEKLMLQDQDQSIQEKAYLIWEREGRPDGQNLAHWLEAEAELAPPAGVAIAKDVKPAKAPAVRARKPRSTPSKS
jgi:hypothetical protein